MYCELTQDQAYDVNARLVAFARESHIVGVWEDDPASITAVAEIIKEKIVGTDLLPGPMVIGWARAPYMLDLSQQVFDFLVDQWDAESGVLSSTTEIVMSPAYQSIMAMGPAVVPYILNQLAREGDQPRNWFWALRHITRTNPIRPEDRGNRKAMA